MERHFTVNKIHREYFTPPCTLNQAHGIVPEYPMVQPRTTSPIVRTYLTRTTSPSGKTRIHARLYAPSYDLDRRGTGTTIAAAVRSAVASVPRPR